MTPTQPARIARAVLLFITVLHLVAQLANAELVADLTQVLLMPAVAGVLLTHTEEPRSRLVRLTMLALFFSWLGDTLPRFVSGDAAFLLMVGGFLLAQLVYVRAFWPYRAESVAARQRWVVPIALVVSIALGVAVAGQDPVLAGPVGLYAAALLAMVIVGTGVNRAVALGAVIFLISDAMIALGAFTQVDLPAAGFAIMATYVGGQSLITLGVAARDRRDRAPRGVACSAGSSAPQ